MNTASTSLDQALLDKFADILLEVQEFRGEVTVVLGREHLVEVCRFCLDLGYNFLSDVSGVDYYPQEPRFGIAYHLYSMLQNRSLRLKVYLSGDDPRCPSITPVYPAANWLEREIFDMLGITFTDHPDLRRILMPEDWEGHPLRKDYPLGYETVQFSFNFEEVDKHKPYAQE